MLRSVRRHLIPSSIAAAALASALLWTRSSGTFDLPLPGPAPRSALEPIEGIGLPKDDRCGQCHTEIAAEWKQSLHRRAWENEYFAHSYASEPLAFCRKCHAPLADPRFEPSAEARAVGVGCTTCHVVPAGIVGTSAIAARADGHEVLGDARLGTAAACANCHDFAFPGSQRPTVDRMQKTHSEHAQSAFSSKPCQNCHMPLVPSQNGGSHRKHDFRVQGDRNMMARAVVVDHAQIKNHALHLDLTPGDVGHAFPTGDLHRRVEIRVTAIDSQGRALGPTSTEILRRTFGFTHEGPSKTVPVEQADNRLLGPKHIELSLPKAAQRARYEIVWQKLPPELAQKFGMKMSDHEMVVLEGIVKR